MSCSQSAPRAPSRPLYHNAASDAARHALGRLGRNIAVWFTRYQTRRVLRELDAHVLRDIGVSPLQAAREAAKPFWID
jgi:uncharacterized protein YjiS (DUF1127 family)